MNSIRELQVSVILPTRNPQRAILVRALTGLAAQDFSQRQWELIIVDNGSTVPLADTIDLRWHSRARILVERNAGKAHALARGISNASGRFVVVLDDDNILAPSYLSEGLKLLGSRTHLAVCGGQITPEFEQQPTVKVQSHLHMLGIVRLAMERESADGIVMPPGAGCIFRAEVAQDWAALFYKDPIRQRLGSRLEPPCSLQEDTDMCLVALSAKHTLGQFPQLSLTHVISRDRVEEEYLLRLTRANGANTLITRWLWDRISPVRPFVQNVVQYCRLWRLPRQQRRYALEYWRGERTAIRFIARQC